MTYRGKFLKGNDRLPKIAEYLGSSFLNNVPIFGETNSKIDDKLLEIYHLNYTNTSMG